MTSPSAAARDVQRRSLNDEVVKLCQEAGNAKKRNSGILARADETIGWDDQTSGSGEDTLYTGNLLTCQGVTVVGEYEDDDTEGDDRFLAHIAGENFGPLDTLLENVKAATDAGLKDVKATVVLMNPDSLPEDRAESGLGEFLSELNEKVIEKVEEIDGLSLFGGVDEEEHDWEEIWQLKIDSDKSISASKQLDNPL